MFSSSSGDSVLAARHFDRTPSRHGHQESGRRCSLGNLLRASTTGSPSPRAGGLQGQSTKSTSSATTRLAILPTPSIVDLDHRRPAGARPAAAGRIRRRPGVPVAITSPGRSVVKDERYSIVRGMSKIICDVRADCMTSPLSRVVSWTSDDVDLVGRDHLGPDRHRPVEVLARRPLAGRPLPLARGGVVRARRSRRSRRAPPPPGCSGRRARSPLRARPRSRSASSAPA